MQTLIPSTSDVRKRLQALRLHDLELVARASGVPFSTLIKIRTGQTGNPGIETVRKFIEHLPICPGQPELADHKPATQGA